MKNKNVFSRDMSANFTRDAGGEDSRRFQLSFSSEAPVKRYGYSEILEHTDEAVDLSRLNEIGVVLFNHHRDVVIAKVEKAWLENGRGVATILFDSDDEAEKIRQKVESGTIKGVSVGYRVSNWEEVPAGEKSIDGRFDGPAMIAKRWEPTEISIASVPADPDVGINRTQEEGEVRTNMDENAMMTEGQQPAGQQNVGREDAVPPSTATTSAETRQNDIESERTRAADITTLCREFDMNEDVERFIKDGSTVDEVRAAVLNNLKSQRVPAGTGVTRDEGDKYRDAAVDAVLMRGSITVQTPAPGATDMRGMSLKDLIRDCARREGIANAERIDPYELARQYFSPTSAFPSILDAAINKAYAQGYEEAPTTFDVWTAKGSLSDFKPTKSQYRPGKSGELELVPEGGEIKHEVYTDHLMPQRKLATYGKQFSMTREAVINDDIGFLTRLPANYAASSRRTINKHVYSILAKNAVIYDGTPLFSAAHKNLVTPGTKPSMEALQSMIKKLLLMTDEEGDPISVAPRYVLVPVGLGDAVNQIIASATIAVKGDDGSYTVQSNPLTNRGLIAVEDAYLNTLAAGSSFAWYLVADKTVIPTIQVDYLNGQEIPTIRRMEAPGQLGYIWDVYHDWAITVQDYRGIIKNEGSNA